MRKVVWIGLIVALLNIGVVAQEAEPAKDPSVAAMAAQLEQLKTEIATLKKQSAKAPTVADYRKAITAAKASPFGQACTAENGKLLINPAAQIVGCVK